MPVVLFSPRKQGTTFPTNRPLERSAPCPSFIYIYLFLAVTVLGCAECLIPYEYTACCTLWTGANLMRHGPPPKKTATFYDDDTHRSAISKESPRHGRRLMAAKDFGFDFELTHHRRPQNVATIRSQSVSYTCSRTFSFTPTIFPPMRTYHPPFPDPLARHKTKKNHTERRNVVGGSPAVRVLVEGVGTVFCSVFL